LNQLSPVQKDSNQHEYSDRSSESSVFWSITFKWYKISLWYCVIFNL